MDAVVLRIVGLSNEIIKYLRRIRGIPPQGAYKLVTIRLGIQDRTFVKGDQQVDAHRGTAMWEVGKIRGQETRSLDRLLSCAQSHYIFRVSLYGELDLPSKTEERNREETTEVPAKSSNVSPRQASPVSPATTSRSPRSEGREVGHDPGEKELARIGWEH